MSIKINTPRVKFLVIMFFLFLVACQQQAEQESPEAMVPVESILLNDAQIQLANIRVSDINESIIGNEVLFTGALKVNEQTAVNVTARSSGRIEKLYFKNTGDAVKIGDPLYQFYSEELVATEREYFTYQHNNWNFSGRYEPSLVLENKLLFLGMLPSQISQLRKDGKILFSITIHSPVEGIIRSVSVTENQYVNGGQVLFELADDTKLWVEAPVYPDDLPLLEVGMPAMVTVPVAGVQAMKSTVSFISPSLEQGTNTTLIRCTIENKDRTLFPGMLAQISVRTHENTGVVIPLSAVLTEKDKSKVWIKNEDGSFSCRIVTTGLQSEDSVLILSGLDEAKMVVISGAYLLNSEFILKKGNIPEQNNTNVKRQEATEENTTEQGDEQT